MSWDDRSTARRQDNSLTQPFFAARSCRGKSRSFRSWGWSRHAWLHASVPGLCVAQRVEARERNREYEPQERCCET